MSSRKIRGGKAEIEATIKDKLGAGLAKLKARLSSFAATSAKLGGGAIVGATAILAPLTASVATFLSAGDAMDKMSARTGETVEQLSTLGFISAEVGSDTQTLEKGIFGMQRTLRGAERGMATSIDALKTMGLTLDDLDGLKPAEQLKLMSTQLAAIDDTGRRGAVAQEVFGRAGRQLLPMLSLGADGIEKMQQQARDLGLEMAGKDATSAAALTDRLFELKEVVKATTFQVGAALAPTLIQVVTYLSGFAKHAIEFIRNNRWLVVGVAAAAIAFGVMGIALLGVGAAAAAASAILSVLGAIMGAITSPIGIIAGLLIGGAANRERSKANQSSRIGSRALRFACRLQRKRRRPHP